jgi:hypothetical protein
MPTMTATTQPKLIPSNMNTINIEHLTLVGIKPIHEQIRLYRLHKPGNGTAGLNDTDITYVFIPSAYRLGDNHKLNKAYEYAGGSGFIVTDFDLVRLPGNSDQDYIDHILEIEIFLDPEICYPTSGRELQRPEDIRIIVVD